MENAKENTMPKKEETRYIVRVVNKDLDGNKNIYRALQSIKGISHRTAAIIANAFQRETGTDSTLKLGSVTEEQQKLLEEIVQNPKKHGVPIWALNRRKEYVTGDDKHLVMSDLDFDERTTRQRLSEIKTYRGLRRTWGLPVRGQRNKSTHRGKRGAVGVKRKDAK